MWSDIQKHPSSKTLRQFAGLWLGFFLILGVYNGLFRHKPVLGIAFVIVAICVGCLGLLFPRHLRPIYVGWIMLAYPIGWVVSQAMLLLMFYGIITPTAIIMRLTGRDVLCRKRPVRRESFWVPKETPSDIARYFRQY